MAKRNGIKEFLKRLFKVVEYERSYSIDRTYKFRDNAIRNRLWYEGDASELQDFYTQVDNRELVNSFWGSDASTKGQDIKRTHVAMPSLIVDTLVNITSKNLDTIRFDDEEIQKRWEELNNEKTFEDVLNELTRTCLIIGDGAVKFSYDLNVSAEKPSAEVVPGDRVRYIRQKGFLKAIEIYTYYTGNKANYTLKETYGYGYVHYNLYKEDGIEVPMNTLPETDGLEDVEFDKTIMLAVPFKFFDSTKYEGRGRSIYAGKSDAFDNIDEIYSIWMTANRVTVPKIYFPDNMLPRDANTGAVIAPNSFDNRYIAVGANLAEMAQNKISVEQPSIDVNGYAQSLNSALEMSIQGILSPSTLGMDMKKTDNAEAQREKEKVTLYTRTAILNELTKIAEKIVKTALAVQSLMHGVAPQDIEVSVNFDEYANPSFETVVETMSNPNTPMSIDAKVEEIWGDRKTEEWKAEEVQRIKNERGVVVLDEPALNTGVEDL